LVYVLIAVVIIIFAVRFYFGKKWAPQVKGKTAGVKALRREYARKAGLPSAAADQHIDEYVRRLQEKNPGRSEEWCLEKMLFDLDRDRG